MHRMASGKPTLAPPALSRMHLACKDQVQYRPQRTCRDAAPVPPLRQRVEDVFARITVGGSRRDCCPMAPHGASSRAQQTTAAAATRTDSHKEIPAFGKEEEPIVEVTFWLVFSAFPVVVVAVVVVPG